MTNLLVSQAKINQFNALN
ncbi:Protein of unknown function [Leuconostoc citreum]|nr:Protein of unknown function [Leuconostoc citreum]